MMRALGPLPGSTTPRATPSTRERAARPTATPPTTRPPRRRAHRSSVVVASPPSAAHRTRASWTTWFATEDDDEDEAASEEPTKTSWSSRDSGFLDDPIVARPPASPSPLLANADLAPVGARDRTFSAADVAALWIGLVVCVPAYTLAGSLLDLGMSAVEAIGCIMVANALVLIPLVLNGHAGTKYGAPFPVLARAAFGARGASVPAVLRALVACGWFGIQTHVGGQAIYAIARSALGVVGSAAVDVPSSAASSPIIAWLGTSAPELACYFLFWTAQVVIVCRGIESIRTLERFAAPVLIALTAALFMWAYGAAGGLGVMLSAPSAFAAGGARAGQFWSVFFPSVTAVVGFWATLSLNISDFTRYATSQKAQCAGQVIGLPVFMALFSFASIAITSCAAAAFGRVISDPIALLAAMNNGPLTTVIAMAGLLAATLSTNIAANVVAPANAFVNCAPEKISFKMGGVLTAVLGTIVAPWRFTADASGYIFTWLIGYSALLGPVTGIMIADYYVVRGRTLSLDGLYQHGARSPYWYVEGFNPAAAFAFALGVLPNVPGFLRAAGAVTWCAPWAAAVYDYAWFVGFGIAFVVYVAMMRSTRRDRLREAKRLRVTS